MPAFVKTQGIGNDFVIVDSLFEPDLPADLPSRLPELAKLVCCRRFGIGADGLILVEKGDAAPYRMRIFNSDGSEPEMCGNGIRCMATYLRTVAAEPDAALQIETGAGVLTVDRVGDGMERVAMGTARIGRGEIGVTGDPTGSFIDQPVGPFRGTAISMGNPHLVIFVDDVGSVDVEALGPQLEKDPLFPNGINVHFIQVRGRGSVVQRTWERGAGVTLACGSGACSAAVAGFLTNRTERNITVDLPGGRLEIEYLPDNSVFMTGPAEIVFSGRYEEADLVRN